MDVQIDTSNTILETERLIIRPWQKSDLEDFYKYASVDGVGEMAGWKHHESKEISEAILNSFIEERSVFALVNKCDGKAIGSLGLHMSWANSYDEYKDLRQKEIGYVLSKDYWGMGFMPEAVRCVLEFCFCTLGLEAVTVGHFTSNIQSERVIEKCGFSFVGIGEYYAKQLDRTFEDMRYIFLRKDWNHESD